MTHGERVDRHSRVSTELALHSDRQLGALLEQSQVLDTGIGGTPALVDVCGIPVFAKRVPLTDLERHPGNVMSTANLFGLSAYLPTASTESAARVSVRGASWQRTP